MTSSPRDLLQLFQKLPPQPNAVWQIDCFWRIYGVFATAEIGCVQISRSIHIVRTNIVIDDELMEEAMKATGIRTKKEVVELGLRTLLQLRPQAAVRSLKGKVAWQGNLEEMRKE